MRNALAEQLLAVRPEETHQGREADEPLLMVDGHFDDEFTVAHPRSVIDDLDLGIGGSSLVQGAAGRLCDGGPESRAHSNAALPPRVDLEDLAALDAVKPVLLPMKVANSRPLRSSTPFVFRWDLVEHLRGPRTTSCSDRVSGFGVEEVEVADVDGQRDTLAGRDRHTRVDPRDALRRGRTRDIPGRLRRRRVWRPHAASAPWTLLASVVKWTSDSLPRASTSSTRAARVVFGSASPPSATVRCSGRIPHHELAVLPGDKAGAPMSEIGRKGEPLRSEREHEPYPRAPRSRPRTGSSAESR